MCDEDEGAASSKLGVKTLEVDPRYPFQNQTKACYDNYCDYYKCERLFKGTDQGCGVFKRYYTIVCPKFWVEHWDDLRAKGAFPGPI